MKDSSSAVPSDPGPGKGVNITGQQSKTFERYLDQAWDVVITVCDQANDACPVFPGGKHRLHWSFPDPSWSIGTDEEQPAPYRSVRDAIRDQIQEFVRDRAERETRPRRPAPPRRRR